MSINDIQNLKKIREIKTHYGMSPNRKLSVEKNILNKIKTPKEHLKKRLKGLENEDEFLLLLLMVSETEQITKLEQKQIINNSKYTIPDYLLSVITPKELGKNESPMAQRMFVEVKKCKENELDFCITKSAYQKIRDYSQLYTLPLYFAVKFDTLRIKQWFFISGKIIEEFGKQEKRQVNNRSQDCFVLSVETIFEKDMSGLWLNNHGALLKKGTIIQKIYDKSITQANMIDKSLGALVSHKVDYGDKSIEKDLLQKNFPLEVVVFSILLKKLARGKRKIKKDGTITTIKFEADNNYFIPYYHIILEAYLHLRQQCKEIQKDSDNTIEYYINNFLDFDRKLLTYIKKGYYDLIDAGVITPIRMMPNFKK